MFPPEIFLRWRPGRDYSARMAWRIHDSVIRGEIDNREKGRVRGRLWLDGLAEPVILELEGNACPDLAGCLLQFKNPATTCPLPRKPGLEQTQNGRIGTLSASRKVRVFTIPDHEAFAMLDRGEQPSERLANALYLEWFSERNGRVVIESTEFELKISSPEWRLSPAEETQRAQDAEAGWTGFVDQLSAALEQQKRGQKDPEADWDEHDYEKLLRESDARTDKYMELREKYGDSDEAKAKITREMGWHQEDEDEDGDESEGGSARISVEEMNRICEEAANAPEPEPDPMTEGKDWIRTEDGELRHPLQHRCFESAMKLWHECDELGLRKAGEEDLHQFIFEFQTASVKLAGALDGLAQGRDPSEAAFTVACLKRALDHLHKSQAGLEAVASRKLLPEKTITEARRELFEIREGILQLMDEFRGRRS